MTGIYYLLAAIAYLFGGILLQAGLSARGSDLVVIAALVAVLIGTVASGFLMLAGTIKRGRG